jgi:type IV pilus assembly protein PilY1
VKRIVVLIISLFIISIPAWIYTQTMSDYCSAPPYVTRTIPPNVTVILDNSQTMLNPAHTIEYDPSRPGDYIGYFKTDKTYCASSNSFYEAATCSGSDKGPYPGSLLNWATMSKYDIVMLVLIGGKGTPAPSSRDKLVGENMDWEPKETNTYPGCRFDMTNQGGLKITDSGGCTLPLITSSGGTPIVVAVSDYVSNVSPRGIIQKLTDKDSDGDWDASAPRIGIMRFQASQNDIKMDYCVGTTGPMASFINVMASDQAKPDRNNPTAPLGLTMLRTIEYYKNICSTTCNPCGDPIDSVQCRKNFVLTISSGEASDIPHPYSADYLNEQIRQAHTSDIRTDRDGTQVINYYDVHIFGASTDSDILKGFSKYGGFVDSNSNKNPDLNGEWDKNGDGIPDTYYEASDSSGIQAAIEKAFQDILAQAASGTAVSVLTTSSRGVGSVVQAYFLPAKIETGPRDVQWTGYMQNVWIDPQDNLREDTIQDYQLILNHDKVMRLYFNQNRNETESALFTTLADGTGGTFASCSSPAIKPFADIKALWEAGKKLALKRPSERTIFTAKKVIRGSAVTMFLETPYPEFKTGMNTAFRNALNPDSTYTADNIVRYVRGECLEAGVTGDTDCDDTADPLYRDRRLTVDGSLRVWKLGDIISSTAKVFAGTPLNTFQIDYADRTYYDYISGDGYKKKSSIAFVGANDGMLHAFRVGYLKDTGLVDTIKAIFKTFFGSGDSEHERLGEEIWAYIPFNAFPYLKYLADPDYCHIYYSDLSVRLTDASVNGGPTSARDQNSWKTILIGGMRFGGACGSGGTPADPPAGTPSDVGFSSYFAVDVTDPENPVPLWEFSDADMGYTTTFPSIIRTGDINQNGNWYVALGSGSKILPKGGVDIGRNTTGYIYILNLSTGELVKKIALDHNAIVGDILAIDVNKDYTSEKIYFGTSYRTGTSWSGKLISIDIQTALSIADVNVSWSSSFGKILFSGTYPFTASPDAAKDTRGNIWVFSGSGKYYSDLDETDTSQQLFFGLKDRGSTVAETALYNATNISTTGTVKETTQVCSYDTATNSFGLRPVVTSVNPTSSAPAEADSGWKIYFPNRERVISRPLAVGGLVDFLTYKPDADPCKYGGDSYLYSVGYTSGVAPTDVAIRSPEATSGTSGTITVYKGIKLGPGAPPAGEAIIIQPPKEGVEQLKKKIQIATGVIVETENQPLFSVVSKIMHWLKK